MVQPATQPVNPKPCSIILMLQLWPQADATQLNQLMFDYIEF